MGRLIYDDVLFNDFLVLSYFLFIVSLLWGTAYTVIYLIPNIIVFIYNIVYFYYFHYFYYFFT